jgi:hypothetical protein
VIPLAVAAMLGLAGTAQAFCRSTTCKGDACPRDADGCKTTGHPLTWSGLCTGFSLQKDGTANLPLADVRKVFRASFATWSELACPGGTSSIAFSELDDAACHAAEFNPDGANANVILFQDAKWDFKGVDDTLAKTTVSFDADTGEILDADIEINTAYNHFTVGDGTIVYDLQSILTHEIGHFVGLDHSLVPDATMNAAYDPGDTSLRTLAPDDVAALCAAYPPNRPGRCDPAPHGGYASECGGQLPAAPEASGCALGASRAQDPGGFYLLAGATALALVRRRRGGIS